MPNKCFYRFSYFTAEKKDRSLMVHQLRDGDAALEVSDLLFESGYRYGGLVLNHPARQGVSVRRVSDEFLQPSDLLLVTTRPPLDDEVDQPRKRVVRSRTTLESKVFDALRAFFHRCSRSQVILSERVASGLPAGFVKRNIQFKQHGGPTYDAYNRQKYVGEAQLTAAYLACLTSAWTGGPGLLCAFGMGGEETLVWTHLLRTRYRGLASEVLSRGGFVMAEIKLEGWGASQDDITSCEKWNVEILASLF